MAGPFPEEKIRRPAISAAVPRRPGHLADGDALHRGPFTRMRRASAYPRCAACRRRKIPASSAVVGHWVLVLAGAFPGAKLAASELGLAGTSARYMRVVSIAAVLFTGLIVSPIIDPLRNWHSLRDDPQVARWRDRGWGFTGTRQKSRLTTPAQ